MSARPELRAALDEEIVAAYLSRVKEIVPTLLADPVRMQELVVQAHATLDVAHTLIVGGSSTPQLSGPRDVGAQRAREGVHPSRSLRAAEVFFLTARPLLKRYYARSAAPQIADDQVVLGLTMALFERVTHASMTYVDALLEQLSASHLQERLRISRELHDRTSHAIGAAISGVDIVAYQLALGHEADPERLAATRRILFETLEDVRALSTRLRDLVGDRTLSRAVGDHLQMVPREHLDVELVDDIPPQLTISRFVAEEMYLIVREAIRNVISHAEAQKLRVRLATNDVAVLAVISDDGRGFDAQAHASADGKRMVPPVGLSSMKERAHGIGGSLAVSTVPGGGTRIELTVPISVVAPRAPRPSTVVAEQEFPAAFRSIMSKDHSSGTPKDV